MSNNVVRYFYHIKYKSSLGYKAVNNYLMPYLTTVIIIGLEDLKTKKVIKLIYNIDTIPWHRIE